MRYVLGFVCVLALGLMGCSETSCPECGGDGEPVTDCTGTADTTPCHENLDSQYMIMGLCFQEVCWAPVGGTLYCAVTDDGVICLQACVEAEDGFPCHDDSGSELGVCEAGVCVFE
jgi:hypothetical protein